MLIYEYRCFECKKHFETIQSIKSDPLKKCKCGGTLKKLISNSSFVLKGTGWYKTDYANNQKSDSSDNDN